MDLKNEKKNAKFPPSQENSTSDGDVNLPQVWHLPWHDLLFPRLLPLLSAEDLFRLRATCSDAKEAVEAYFSLAKKLVSILVVPTRMC